MTTTAASSSRTVQIAFGLALAIMLALSVIASRSSAASNESDRLVRHTFNVLRNLQNLRFAMEGMAATIRGYVLSGQSFYVDAYRAHRTGAEQSAAALHGLLTDNLEQEHRLTEVDRLVAVRIRRAEDIIEMYRVEGPEAAAKDIRVGPGRQNTDTFQTVFREIFAEEQRLLALREAAAKRDSDRIDLILKLGTLFGLLITAAAGWIVHRDGSKRARAEDALFAEKERAQVTLGSIGDAVACTDSAGNITFLNAVAETLSGWALREAAGRPMSDVVRILDGASHEAIPDSMQRAIEQNGTLPLVANCLLVCRGGAEIPIEGSVAPIHDRKGRASGAVIVFRDVTVARAMALQLAHAAEHDNLTGLPNRMLLSDRVGQAIAVAPRHHKQLAVLFLDLDGFKHVNDSLGHLIGDKLLQSVAKRLLDCVRVSDTVSRQGGDEFVVLLPEIHNLEDAAVTANRMLQAVAHVHIVDGHELLVTTSIGVSVYPDDGTDAVTLIKNADAAMYQAKDKGREGYQFFKPAMNMRAVERQSIEESLRRALERRELALHYQPKVDLATGAITGAEALIRWAHPTRGSVSPAQFISIAEACGLMLPIGAWVLREACTQARDWAVAGLPLGTIAINVSGLEFHDEHFVSRLFAILDETGLDPKCLQLDVTELTLMDSPESTVRILEALRGRGVQVAVDDFGTGSSSLGHLRHLPVDALKIDQSLVGKIGGSGEDTAIVTAVIGLARGLKLRVVAEGVETEDELALLRAHHCDEAQGYYFSRPIPAQQFAKLLETGIPKAAVAA